MFDYLVGLVLMGLGLRHPGTPASVKGDEIEVATPSSNVASSSSLHVVRPKWSAENQEAFQKERTSREANLKRVNDTRIKELKETFTQKQKARLTKDQSTQEILEKKVQTFKDAKKKEKILALSENFQTTVTKQLTTMQTKLESMMSLLDRVTAASGALKTQGKDVTTIESDIAAAQAKVSSALFTLSTLTESLPTTFSISTEDGAKEDVLTAIKSVKSSLEPVRTAFRQAHEAVAKAVTDLEAMTNAEEINLGEESQ